MSTGAERLDTIDGLRGIAALMVVASHASAIGMNLVPGVSLEGIGKYGVFLFFVISAHLLTAQWLRATQPFAPRTLVRYFVRRFARIYPLYTLVLLVGWALTPPGLGVRLDATSVWRHLTLREGEGVYWSVPVEFLYYLVIPPLAWWLMARLPPMVRIVGVGAALAGVMTAYPSAQAPLNSIQLAYYLPAFVCGSLAAWWLHRQGNALDAVPRIPAFAYAADACVALVVVATIPAVFGAWGLGDGATTLHRQFLAWGAFWALVVIGLHTRFLPLTSALMRSRWIGRCGQWCFGIYLLHIPFLLAVNKLPLLPGLVKGYVGVAAAIGAAALAWRFVERPAIRFASRWR